MKKNYILKIIFFAMLAVSTTTYAQSNTGLTQETTSENIEGLNIFPNPVNNGKVYISTKHNLAKNIEIYDVLGKKIMSQVLYGKELKIADLSPGVYILKIKEGKSSATRKLVVR